MKQKQRNRILAKIKGCGGSPSFSEGDVKNVLKECLKVPYSFSCKEMKSGDNGDEDGREDTADFIISSNPPEEQNGVSTVRAATLEKLAEFCVREFEQETEDKETKLSNAVFMTHRWFVRSEELLEKFVSLYTKSVQLTYESTSSLPFDISTRAVCQAVRCWMSKYGNDFKKNEQVTTLMEKLHSQVADEKERHIIDLSNIGSEEFRNRGLSIAMAKENSNSYSTHKLSLSFNDMEPKTIAEQLTYLEYRSLRKIPFTEWKTYAKTGKLKETTHLERCVAQFNGLSRWVQAMVLNQVTPEERAEYMKKFQEVSKHLKDLRNFNSLMAVIGGMTSSSLQRLHQTQALLPANYKEFQNLLTELLSSSTNYSSYRKKLSSCLGFSVPILGIQLKDLIAVDTALPDTLPGGRLINVQKMMRLYDVLSKMVQVQTMPPAVHPKTGLMDMLRLSLATRLTDEELFELSLAREPRSLSQNSSQNSLKSEDSGNSILFADWVSALKTTPDPQTTERHVATMVEAVFSFYDTNRDGSISAEEFDGIATNFPFIDAFRVLDVDRDGMISKDEMKNYFMKANCQKLGQGFVHSFQEQTYFTVTFCDHCGGLMWGIVKQGFKCKDCLLNCHKNCRFEIVRECRVWTPLPSQMNGAVDGKLHSRAGGTIRRVMRKSRTKSPKSSRDEERLKRFNRELDSIDIRKHLRAVEDECRAYQAENIRLSSQIEESNKKMKAMQENLNQLRQTTVTFILEQMDALQMQKDTEV